MCCPDFAIASSKAHTEIGLPEFGHSFSWVMCRNPMCKNFGVPYNGELPVGNQKSTADKADDNHERYRLSAEGRFCCKHCGQSFILKSNQDCPSYHRNVFEHYGVPHSPYYRADGDYRVACRACGRKATDDKPDCAYPFRFSLGKARQMGEMDRWMKRRLKRLISGTLHSLSVSDAVEVLGELDMEQRNRRLKRRDIKSQPRLRPQPKQYYNHLVMISCCLRDYHAWRNARLLHPGRKREQALRQAPAPVYTDVMQVTLRKRGTEGRFVHLDLIVSVLKQKGTYFLLAVHPFFMLPEKRTGKVAKQPVAKPPKDWKAVDARHSLVLSHPNQSADGRPPSR